MLQGNHANFCNLPWRKLYEDSCGLFFHPLWCGNASAQFFIWQRNYQILRFSFTCYRDRESQYRRNWKNSHVEFLIRLLQKEYKVATLSRGYGRHTKGFMLLKAPANTWTYGDEPMQYFTKFPAIRVSVGEDRTEAIEELMRLTQRPDIILMDDAYQHRYVNGVTHFIDWIRYYFQDRFSLPAGNCRNLSVAKRGRIQLSLLNHRQF